ncbi:hypothetical protein MRB53_011785 [Persea americana]|uniref:Uncharacterized protein n=1 Tax=Persea americana TaxID=3435 RepID=A0ACC2LWC8_PERAE|nr:hypothetical protein MRB53_011785 [Persea americana]
MRNIRRRARTRGTPNRLAISAVQLARMSWTMKSGDSLATKRLKGLMRRSKAFLRCSSFREGRSEVASAPSGRPFTWGSGSSTKVIWDFQILG